MRLWKRFAALAAHTGRWAAVQPFLPAEGCMRLSLHGYMSSRLQASTLVLCDW
ncbi:MAG TPA: hypothetical protein IAA58_01415 [Candidatus Gallacutalibacter stercoravium]|nr:hypothetical protein [Candidatus Gallacutalibacter stercoravium]